MIMGLINGIGGLAFVGVWFFVLPYTIAYIITKLVSIEEDTFMELVGVIVWVWMILSFIGIYFIFS